MNEANQPQIDPSDEISLAELWIKVQSVVAYLWRFKFLIAAVGLAFAVGGYFKVKLAKPSYTASLTFALEQGGGGGGLAQEAAAAEVEISGLRHRRHRRR